MRRLLIPVAFFAANAYSQAPPRHPRHLPLRADVPWSQFGHDPQHTALSARPAQPLRTIRWQTPVDLSPPTSAQNYTVHYGSPVITADNTVIVPVKTGTYGGFEIEALDGATGTLLYTLPTDYTLPPLPEYAWLLPYQPVLSGSRLYYAGAGGTVYYRDLTADRESNGPAGASGQMAFYGIDLYMSNQAAFNNEVQISTPLTVDRSGDLFFGFIAVVGNSAGLVSGIARLAPDGTGTWISAVSLTGLPNFSQLAFACAPALSNDQSIIYAVVALNVPDFDEDTGYLVSLDAATLTTIADVALNDPEGGLANVNPLSSATPMVGPDGDVYYGVLASNGSATEDNGRGWLLHFDSTLTETKTPGSFGWDDTPSIVPARAVPAYKGTSSYLILTKYNNGNGVNQVAILDPNAQMQDEYSTIAPVMVMQEVITVTGVTPNPTPGFPNAVKEWCINSTAIDPYSKSAILNSEDGTAYRWDFTTNTLSQSVPLGPGIAEAYTPTAIGPDGTAYAINDAILFAIGN